MYEGRWLAISVDSLVRSGMRKKNLECIDKFCWIYLLKGSSPLPLNQFDKYSWDFQQQPVLNNLCFEKLDASCNVDDSS